MINRIAMTIKRIIEKIKYGYNLENLYQKSIRKLFQKNLDSKLIEHPAQIFSIICDNLITNIYEIAAEARKEYQKNKQ